MKYVPAINHSITLFPSYCFIIFYMIDCKCYCHGVFAVLERQCVLVLSTKADV